MVSSLIRHLLVHAVLLAGGTPGYNPSALFAAESHRESSKGEPSQPPSRNRRTLTTTWGPAPASPSRINTPPTPTSLPRLQ
jgi:hypothetical protein